MQGFPLFQENLGNDRRISSPENIIKFCILLIILENSNDPTQNPSWLLCCIPCEGHFFKAGLTRHRENGEFKCSLYQRRKTGNLPKKSVFAQEIYLQHRKKLKIKGCTRVVVGYMWWDIIFWGKKKNKEMLKTEGTLPDWSVKA